MNYISHRNVTVSSVSGRSQHFIKGEPTWAPPQMHAELVAMGILPVEEIPEVEVDGVREPMVAAEREAALYAVFTKMITRNKREEFTGVGLPHMAVLAKELGWSVAAKERDATWHKFQQETEVV